MTTRPDPRYAGYRHPAEIIAAAVRLDFRFPLSLRMVEALLAARGITVSDGTVRQWARKYHLWRAVDQDGFVPDVLVQSRRDTRAAPSLTIGRPAPRRSRSGPKSPEHHWRRNPQTGAARRPRSARRSTSRRCRPTTKESARRVPIMVCPSSSVV